MHGNGSLFLFMYRGYRIGIVLGKHLILASASPRRQHLLRQIGLAFEVRESNIDEPINPRETPEQNVVRIAMDKALAVVRPADDAYVVGADTVVVLDDAILGKPKDGGDAVSMLARLSGREHVVYTGFAIITAPSGRMTTGVEKTTVRFRKLGTKEIEEYVATGSPLDKAGAYGIQDDYGAVFVERIEGCFYNVVGFPLTKFYSTISAIDHNSGRSA